MWSASPGGEKVTSTAACRSPPRLSTCTNSSTRLASAGFVPIVWTIVRRKTTAGAPG
jgi:hypothetical protein